LKSKNHENHKTPSNGPEVIIGSAVKGWVKKFQARIGHSLGSDGSGISHDRKHDCIETSAHVKDGKLAISCSAGNENNLPTETDNNKPVYEF